ncbi:hypothetical protein GIB67_024660 [Kingdonia uniflora]|uniref:Uncharacterized protein n=1 Tax=Kingdonia uniflora TaxID=39325 RepID=A0A7J7LP81_9MAGN|nr:hypothetical protein GIB67_024660 [Kingdonia uniflora]
MAYKQLSIMFLRVVAILIPEAALAKEIAVGDDSVWTIKFDYQVWAAPSSSTIKLGLQAKNFVLETN